MLSFLSSHLLSLTIWVPIAFGVLVLAMADDAKPASARWIALAGSIGYAAAGWDIPGRPEWSIGFVYLPALVGISASSLFLAPFGARLAHRMPARRLRRIFALVLLAMSAKVAVSI